MKNINKYLICGLAAVAAASCADLDTEFYTDYVTTDQKESTLQQNPERAIAAVTAVSSEFGSFFGQVYDEHFDYGYPSIMMGLDSQTDDYLAKIPYTSSHVYWFRFVAPNPNGVPTGMAWYHLYKQIKTANALLATIPSDTDNNELKFYRAQGLGVRAFDYWVLAQLYQFTYVGNEQKPCVPIITDENELTAASEGAPRATVDAVYTQILNDLNEAITLLDESGITPERVMEIKPKRMMSLAAAYGMRARVYLTMGKYTEAENDANSAITAFKGRPYTRAEVSVPSFNLSEDPSWMWAIIVSETDRPSTTGICNWPSQQGSFNDGYANYGGWRWCSKKLYDAIPATDVRKGWFLDANYKSANLSASQQAYLDQYVNEDPNLNIYQTMSINIMPYTQVKFGLYGGALGKSPTYADVPLMRIEEMYMIVAECQAMSNPTTGLQTLANFVTAYRDADYVAPAAASSDEAREEIIKQRRIEFWGEGLAWFDVMRLNKGIDRTGCYAFDNANIKIEPNDPVLIYCIPQEEINANAQISAADNNPTGTRPTPIPQSIQ